LRVGPARDPLFFVTPASACSGDMDTASPKNTRHSMTLGLVPSLKERDKP
jgi:hypothetical protein